MKITIIFPARDFEIGKATMPVMPVAPTFFTQTSLKKSFREQFKKENSQKESWP
jgi:hypothetical protein